MQSVMRIIVPAGLAKLLDCSIWITCGPASKSNYLWNNVLHRVDCPRLIKSCMQTNTTYCNHWTHGAKAFEFPIASKSTFCRGSPHSQPGHWNLPWKRTALKQTGIMDSHGQFAQSVAYSIQSPSPRYCPDCHHTRRLRSENQASLRNPKDRPPISGMTSRCLHPWWQELRSQGDFEL